jgi:hypothetical protein
MSSTAQTPQSRRPAGARRARRAIGTAVVLPLAVAGLAAQALTSAPAAVAGTSHCLVINGATDTSYKTVQAAVNAAAAGATLWVRGTCTGTTEIGTDLTFTGQQPAGFTAPTLNGGGQGSTLTVDSGAAVTINTLTITGGSGTLFRFGREGGGIFDAGTVTLNNSSISGNTVTGAGGGIVMAAADGTVTLNNSSISGNTVTAAGGSGGGIASNGTVTLNGSSSITGNTAPQGGAIDNVVGGTVTLNGSSSISGNTARFTGGGINNLVGSTVTLNDSSSITGNTANGGPGSGGGIFNSRSTVTGATATNITGNTPDNCGPPGSVPGCIG